MKKIYTAPEANLLYFEPQENLAFSPLNESGMGAGAGSGSSDLRSGTIQI
jgi:hypothetical protein